MIVVSDQPHSDPEAVARIPGHLTEEDEERLQGQGVPANCKDELAIAKERCKLDKRYSIVGVMSGKPLSRVEVMKSIADLLTSTQNDGGKMYL